MTVEELIKKLESFPKDALVFLNTQSYHELNELKSIVNNTVDCILDKNIFNTTIKNYRISKHESAKNAVILLGGNY